MNTPSLFDLFDEPLAAPFIAPVLPAVQPIVQASTAQMDSLPGERPAASEIFNFSEREPEREFYLVFRLNQPGNPLLYDYTTMAEYAAFKAQCGKPQAARWSCQPKEGAALCCASKEIPDGTNEN